MFVRVGVRAMPENTNAVWKNRMSILCDVEPAVGNMENGEQKNEFCQILSR
jgi:hypothetical protein